MTDPEAALLRQMAAMQRQIESLAERIDAVEALHRAEVARLEERVAWLEQAGQRKPWPDELDAIEHRIE